MTTEEMRESLIARYNNPPTGEHAYEAFERAMDELAEMSDDEIIKLYNQES